MRLNHGQRGRFRPSRVPSNPLARGGLLHVRTGDRRLQPAGSGPHTAFKAQTRENKFTLLGDPPPEAPTPPQNTRWTGRLQTSPPFQRRASLPGGSRESRPAADSALPGTAPSREPRAAAGPRRRPPAGEGGWPHPGRRLLPVPLRLCARRGGAQSAAPSPAAPVARRGPRGCSATTAKPKGGGRRPRGPHRPHRDLPRCAARRGPLELLTEEEAVTGGVRLAALLGAVEGHGAVRPRPCTPSPGQEGGSGGRRAPAPAGAQERQQRAHGGHGCRARRGAVLGTLAQPRAGAPCWPEPRVPPGLGFRSPAGRLWPALGTWIRGNRAPSKSPGTRAEWTLCPKRGKGSKMNKRTSTTPGSRPLINAYIH